MCVCLAPARTEGTVGEYIYIINTWVTKPHTRKHDVVISRMPTTLPLLHPPFSASVSLSLAVIPPLIYPLPSPAPLSSPLFCLRAEMGGGEGTALCCLLLSRVPDDPSNPRFKLIIPLLSSPSLAWLFYHALSLSCTSLSLSCTSLSLSCTSLSLLHLSLSLLHLSLTPAPSLLPPPPLLFDLLFFFSLSIKLHFQLNVALLTNNCKNN